ncbi:MAG: hypothetical protein JST06_01260 [Bacteroidetes bacterium]|nr:hypothetical protein [Bacteroidota bacterium]
MYRIFSTQWDGRFRLPRLLPALIIVFSCLLLLLLSTLFCYVHPSILDDYENIAWLGFLKRQGYLFLEWSGRYFSNAAVSLSPLRGHSLTDYRWVLLGVFLLFTVSFLTLLLALLRRFSKAPVPVRLATALAGIVLFCNNIPSLQEGFFWYSSAMTYMLPVAAAFGMFSLLFYAEASASPSWFTRIFALLLAIVALGGNETLYICLPIVFVLWWQARRRADIVRQKFYFWLLLTTVLCLLISLLAPGNYVRQSLNPRPGIGVLFLWLKVSLLTGWSWLSNPFLLLFSGLTVWFLSGYELKIFRIRLWQAFLLPFLFLLLLLLPATLGLGEQPPPRVFNEVYAFFLLGWLVFLLRLIQYLAALQFSKSQFTFLRQASLIAYLLLLLVSFNTNDLRQANFFRIPKSYLRHIPQQYDHAWLARYAEIATATADTLYLKPIPAKSGNPVFFFDITFWPSNSNRFFAQYWGRKMVLADTTGHKINAPR